MRMEKNEFTFLSAIIEKLLSYGLDVCIFGGWAEELRGIRKPSSHSDIDILIRANNFCKLENVLKKYRKITEISKKRFSHKRAYSWNGMRVEFFLVKPSAKLLTSVFDGRLIITWPTDTFADSPIFGLPVASEASLKMYRQAHKNIESAYLDYCNVQEGNG